MKARELKDLALECGFELAGVARALPIEDYGRYERWVGEGRAGRMSYLTDHRAAVRADPRRLLASARSVLCVGKQYNTASVYSTEWVKSGEGRAQGWISRYAWGDADYHDVLRTGLQRVADGVATRLADRGDGLEYRICVDTAPLLERSYARAAGLGWIGKNTCLINQGRGSWFFLGELLLSIDLEPDEAPPDRCGTCTRCIDACPTRAIVPDVAGGFTLDAQTCISYYTIELKGDVPEDQRAGIGRHVFGCDICQDVCPWNRRSPVTTERGFAGEAGVSLEEMAFADPHAFRARFAGTPVARTGYRSFLRNVAIAMGNSGEGRFREPLTRMAASEDPVVARHAAWALQRIAGEVAEQPCE